MNLKYRWLAVFEHKVIGQPEDDRYSKHNPDADWNPSSFRDFQDYFDEHPSELQHFELWGQDDMYYVDFWTDPKKPMIKHLKKGSSWGSDEETILEREKSPLKDLRVIYYRNMQMTIKNGQTSSPEVLGYVLGYQGIDKSGKNRQKIITVL